MKNEKNNDTKDYSEQLEFLNSQPYYASKKLLTSHQIFRYAVPARTVTKKHWCEHRVVEQLRSLALALLTLSDTVTLADEYFSSYDNTVVIV